MAFNWTGSIIKGAGMWDQLDRLDEQGSYIESELDQMRDDYTDATKFTPFTVAGPYASSTMSADGLQMNISAEEMARSGNRATQSDQFFNQAAGGYDQYQQGVYDDIRSTQMPEEQRAMAAQEQRLLAQGRGGMRTNQYGGSPEQLAMQKAIGENRNAASSQAWLMGQQQQAQDANLGQMFQTAQYMPQAQALNMLNPALQGAQLQQAGQLAGANIGAQLGLGQVQSQVNTEQIRANMLGNLFNDIGNAAATEEFDPVKTIFNEIIEGFSK